MTASLNVEVVSIVREARDVLSFEFSPSGGGHLPPFTAGSHINIELPNRQIRSYSLINPESERHRYVVAVRKDPNGRGGSVFMHDELRVGTHLCVSPPRNNFPLIEADGHVQFIAGGIGITPILCMIQKLEKVQQSWELYYCARTADDAAFVPQLRELDAQRGRVKFVFDHGDRGRMLDIGAVVSSALAGAHFYCCGPTGMLQAFEAAAGSRPRSHVHVEYFSSEMEPASAGGFVVELARTKKTILVKPGESILWALRAAGVSVPHACMQGVCGTCETSVIEGAPDHRDLVLSTDEKLANRTMMICCSGCRGEKLVLDL